MQKQSHQAVNYGPGHRDGDHCAVCRFFHPERKTDRCDKVVDPIDAMGWCEEFKKRASRLRDVR